MLAQRRLRTKPWYFTLTHRSRNELLPSDTARYCDHDCSIGKSCVRFPLPHRPGGLDVRKARERRLLHGPVWMRDCPISLSVSTFRRPRPTSGCSRCERSSDTSCWCATSKKSRIANRRVVATFYPYRSCAKSIRARLESCLGTVGHVTRNVTCWCCECNYKDSVSWPTPGVIVSPLPPGVASLMGEKQNQRW